jgi:hypothetical protein
MAVKLKIWNMEGVTKMAIWKYKACPRCHGDVFFEKESDGWLASCLQCGFSRFLGNKNRVPRPRIENEQKVLVH